MKKLLHLVLFSLFLVLPTQAYQVKRGDTVSQLAYRNNTTVAELTRLNNLKDPNKIYVGQELELGETLGVYNPVTAYSSRTTGYISASAATIPVASTLDKSGLQISLANISSAGTVKVYMNLAPGTTNEEPIVCTGVTATSWTNCTRGLVFQGNSEAASTTLQKAHNAGTVIVITNIGQFYNQYVSVDGNQTIGDIKTFASFPKIATSTALPTANAELASKYYVDTVGAGGFTAANVSTTRGLSVDGSSPEKVGVNVSSTGGLFFGLDGKLAVSSTANSGIVTTNTGTAVDRTDSFSWTGEHVFFATTTLATTTVNGSSFTATPTSSSIPISNASGTLDQWVTASTSFTLFPGTILEDNTWFTSTVVLTTSSINQLYGFNFTFGTQGGVTLGAAGGRIGNYLNMILNSSGGLDLAFNIMGVDTPTSSRWADNKEIRTKWRTKFSSAPGTVERAVGFVDNLNTFELAVSSNATSSRFALGANNALYAVTGSGTANTNTDLSSLVSSTQWNTYAIQLTTTSAKYYVNGILRATHTTVPTSISPMAFGFGTSDAGQTYPLSMSDIIMSQKM